MKKTKTGDSIHLTLGGIIEADMPERRTRVERRRIHVDLSEVGIKEDRRRVIAAARLLTDASQLIDGFKVFR